MLKASVRCSTGPHAQRRPHPARSAPATGRCPALALADGAPRTESDCRQLRSPVRARARWPGRMHRARTERPAPPDAPSPTAGKGASRKAPRRSNWSAWRSTNPARTSFEGSGMGAPPRSARRNKCQVTALADYSRAPGQTKAERRRVRPDARQAKKSPARGWAQAFQQ